MQYPSPDRPLGVKLLNRIGSGLFVLGIQRPRLNAERLMAAASKKTGLTEFGGTAVIDNLERLIEAFEREARLSQVGRFAVASMLTDNLVSRLQIIDYRKSHPEIASQKVSRPLFVMGLPRTGSTILYELLAQDPAHRAPISWEVALPIPPANEDSFISDQRIEIADKTMQQVEILAPGFKAIHEVGARLPQECVTLLAPHFISDQYGASFFMPEHRRQSLDADMTGAYYWHMLFLQHLQANFTKERWVLKTPAHLPYLEAIVKQYPDAAIVQTHRNPMDVMGSVASLACTLRSGFSDHVDPYETGRSELAHFSDMLKRGMQQRQSIEEREQLAGSNSRFFDIYFDDIISDPLNAIASMYRHFGFDFSDTARSNMQTYLDNRPREKHGKHRYQLADFGLNRERHKKYFERYCSRFGV